MYDIFICEDVEIQLHYIENILTDYIECRKIDARIICAEQNPAEILLKLDDHMKFPVFFIDVQLKGYGMDGFALAKRLKEINRDYAVVFITSNEQMAYKVFEYGLDALDYIVKKPYYFNVKVPDEELINRLNNIFRKIADLAHKDSRPSIVITSGKRMIEIILNDVIYIQSVKGAHLIEIYLYNRIITIRQSLKSIYEQLGGDFVYINKSCVVNTKKIKEFDKKERLLYMDGGFKTEIAYREIKRIEDLLNK